MVKATLSLRLTLLSVCLAAVAVHAQYGDTDEGAYGEPHPMPMEALESCGDLGQACCGPEERAALGTDIPCPLSPGISCCDGVCIEGTFCASDEE